jgi:hypothetical protein
MGDIEINKGGLPRALIVRSAILAVSASLLPVLFPLVYRGVNGSLLAYIASCIVSVLWIVVLIRGFKRHGRAAAWLLLEAPFALCGPLTFLLLWLVVQFGHDTV